jgi:hypothetical protein
MKLKKQKNSKNGFEQMPDIARATKGFGATLKRQSPKQKDKSVKKLRSRTRSLTSIKSTKSNKASRTKFKIRTEQQQPENPLSQRFIQIQNQRNKQKLMNVRQVEQNQTPITIPEACVQSNSHLDNTSKEKLTPGKSEQMQSMQHIHSDDTGFTEMKQHHSNHQTGFKQHMLNQPSGPSLKQDEITQGSSSKEGIYKGSSLPQSKSKTATQS